MLYRRGAARRKDEKRRGAQTSAGDPAELVLDGFLLRIDPTDRRCVGRPATRLGPIPLACSTSRSSARPR